MPHSVHFQIRFTKNSGNFLFFFMNIFSVHRKRRQVRDRIELD